MNCSSLIDSLEYSEDYSIQQFLSSRNQSNHQETPLESSGLKASRYSDDGEDQVVMGLESFACDEQVDNSFDYNFQKRIKLQFETLQSTTSTVTQNALLPSTISYEIKDLQFTLGAVQSHSFVSLQLNSVQIEKLPAVFELIIAYKNDDEVQYLEMPPAIFEFRLYAQEVDLKYFELQQTELKSDIEIEMELRALLQQIENFQINSDDKIAQNQYRRVDPLTITTSDKFRLQSTRVSETQTIFQSSIKSISHKQNEQKPDQKYELNLNQNFSNKEPFKLDDILSEVNNICSDIDSMSFFTTDTNKNTAAHSKIENKVELFKKNQRDDKAIGKCNSKRSASVSKEQKSVKKKKRSSSKSTDKSKIYKHEEVVQIDNIIKPAEQQVFQHEKSFSQIIEEQNSAIKNSATRIKYAPQPSAFQFYSLKSQSITKSNTSLMSSRIDQQSNQSAADFSFQSQEQPIYPSDRAKETDNDEEYERMVLARYKQAVEESNSKSKTSLGQTLDLSKITQSQGKQQKPITSLDLSGRRILS